MMSEEQQSTDFFDLSSMDPQHRRIVEARIIVKERDKAKKLNNFVKSDALRGFYVFMLFEYFYGCITQSDKLREVGVEVIDQVNGPSGWKFMDGSSKKLPPGTAVPSQAVTKKDTTETQKRGRESEEDNSNKKSKKAAVSEKSNKPEVASSKEHSRNLAALSSVLSTSSTGNVVQGVTIVETKVGSGPPCVAGQRVKVNYVGKLKSNNKIFDSSTKKPFVFRLGKGEVIRGWDIGVDGMRVGGKRQLTIPPEKAYGRQGAPPTIPGNAVLVFDVALVEIMR